MVNLDNIMHYNLILTKKCNMDCVYCIQCGKDRKIKDEAVLPLLSPKELVSYFPSNNKAYQIVFFGGEPLIKFDYMIEFSRLIKLKNPSVVLSIVTNGSLLTIDKVKKINDLDIRVTISHDGVCYETTRRKKDILYTNGDVIASIKKLGFICTISSNNWNFYDNWNYIEEWRLLYNIKRPTVCIIFIRDVVGNINPSLMVYNNKDFEQMLDKVFFRLKESIVNKDFESYEYKCYKRVLERIYFEGILKTGVTSCLSKRDVLNIDTFGNVYRCHNILDIVDGNINNSQDIKEDVNKISDRCKQCDLEWVCPKCPRIQKDKQKYYCYVQKQVYYRILNMLQEIIDEGVKI